MGSNIKQSSKLQIFSRALHPRTTICSRQRAGAWTDAISWCSVNPTDCRGRRSTTCRRRRCLDRCLDRCRAGATQTGTRATRSLRTARPEPRRPADGRRSCSGEKTRERRATLRSESRVGVVSTTEPSKTISAGDTSGEDGGKLARTGQISVADNFMRRSTSRYDLLYMKYQCII